MRHLPNWLLQFYHKGLEHRKVRYINLFGHDEGFWQCLAVDCDKIESCGIVGPISPQFSSYLSSEKQVVQVKGFIFDHDLVTSGEFQGSVLCPFLFLLSFNDVLDTIWNCVPFLFTDDIKLIYTFPFKALQFTINNVSQDWVLLSSWATDWMMKFSAVKKATWGLNALYPKGTQNR